MRDVCVDAVALAMAPANHVHGKFDVATAQAARQSQAMAFVPPLLLPFVAGIPPQLAHPMYSEATEIRPR